MLSEDREISAGERPYPSPWSESLWLRLLHPDICMHFGFADRQGEGCLSDVSAIFRVADVLGEDTGTSILTMSFLVLIVLKRIC